MGNEEFMPSDIGAMYEIDNYLNEAVVNMRKAGKKVDEVGEMLLSSGIREEGEDMSFVRGMIDGTTQIFAKKVNDIKDELDRIRKNVLKLFEVV